MHHVSAALVLVASSFAAAPLSAQEPKIDLKIVCDAWGEPRPRDADREDGAFFLVGHKLHWEVGPKRFRSTATLRAELARLQADPALKGSPLLIQPGPSTCVGDVVLTIDTARQAGFETVRVDRAPLDFDLRRIAPEAGLAQRDITPASTTTAAEKAAAWSPELAIDQRGRIEVEGEVQHDPDQKQSLAETVRVALFKLLTEARGRGLVGFERKGDSPREVALEPLLIRADKWTEWHWVAAVLEQCAGDEAAFRRARLAVTEVDGEGQLLRQR